MEQLDERVIRHKQGVLLAKVINTSFALSEEHCHAGRHVYPQESVEIPYHSCHSSKNHSLCDAMFSKVLPTERCYLKIEFNDKRAIQAL
jgi:hypothetical protein